MYVTNKHFPPGNMMHSADNTAAIFSFHQLHLRKKEDREKRELKAKSVCNGCPVKFECLEEAYEISEPFGVLGRNE